MMICPNKICKQEILDDSCFCDQCGIQLLRCDKCGFVGTGKFCGSCGGSMSAVQPQTVQSGGQLPSPPSPSSTPINKTPAASSPAATVIVSLPTDKIFLCSTEGWNMEIANGNILGRTTGPHASALGKFPVISSTHAKVTLEKNEWFITDLNSTNKTYVNGVKLEPNIPVKIKQDDVVILANVTFTVRNA